MTRNFEKIVRAKEELPIGYCIVRTDTTAHNPKKQNCSLESNGFLAG